MSARWPSGHGIRALLVLLAWLLPLVRAAGLTSALDADDACGSQTTRRDASCALSAVQVLRSQGGQGQHAATGRPAAPGGLTLLTVETRDLQPCILEVNNFTSRTGLSVESVGQGEEWHGYRTKVVLTLEKLSALRERLGPDAAAKELVVFMDSSDVFWGGCEVETFLTRYRELVAQQGAPIIFGGEIIWPNAVFEKDIPIPEPVAPGFWTPYISGCGQRCNGAWRDICSGRKLPTCCTCHPSRASFPALQVPGLDPDRPDLRWLNSGFFIGPVDKVADMMRWVLDHYNSYSVPEIEHGDQQVFAAYWQTHPSLVTLDYRGELVVNLGGLGSNSVKVDRRNGIVTNEPLGQPACFLHAQGPGRYLGAHLLDQLNVTLAEIRAFILAEGFEVENSAVGAEIDMAVEETLAALAEGFEVAEIDMAVEEILAAFAATPQEGARNVMPNPPGRQNSVFVDYKSFIDEWGFGNCTSHLLSCSVDA